MTQDPPRPPGAPTLLVIIGPPAVGRMTVGAELARRTGLRLFHHHHTIDGRVLFVELEATQEERLRRNETPFRLQQKPLKRDLETSRGPLVDLDERYQLNSAGRFDNRDN